MIAYLKGSLIQKSPESIVVDVNGVGYQVFVSLTTFYELPDLNGPVTLKIHSHIREEDFKLFGFTGDLEKTVFEKLIGISKVGPKLALTILSGMTVEDLIAAVSQKDVGRISRIPGVGPKTAERLALELKDKLKDIQGAVVEFQKDMPAGGVFEDALSALINLGYKRPQAEKALKSASNNGVQDGPLEDLIKNALKLL